jgi:tRNA(fMet)-specific endonuclease VapC
LTSGYLLDTNIIGHYFTEHPFVRARVDTLPEGTILMVSAISLGEIVFGHEYTVSTNHSRREECNRFINERFPDARTLEVSRHTRIPYGELKAELFRRFPPQNPRENHPERCFCRATGSELGIDENDLWIAAQAIEHNLILVTNDEMRRIRDVSMSLLDIEDWTEPL